MRPPQVVGPHPGGGPTLMDGPNGLTLPGHPAARPRMLGWNPGAPLATAWGTLRYPVADATEVEPSDHGLILVPGVAFAPAGNPSVVDVVFIEKGGHGSESAAPAVREIYEALFAPDGRLQVRLDGQ